MARPRLRPFFLAVLAAAAVAAILFVAGMGSRKLFVRKPSRRSPAASQVTRLLFAQADSSRFRVTSIHVPRDSMHHGRTYELQAGHLLSLQDITRTAPHARALIRRGGSENEVRENLEIRVEPLAEQTAKFSVLSADGNLSASVAG